MRFSHFYLIVFRFEASDSLDKVAEALMKGVHRVMVGAGVDTEDRKVSITKELLCLDCGR